VLQNVVYAKTLKLSPLVVFIAALIGATLAGIVGVLLAIPLASAGWTLGRDLIVLRQARHAARINVEGCDDGEPVDPGPPPAAEGVPGGPVGA
jgi:predicted PurR-regulated permease PerM